MSRTRYIAQAGMIAAVYAVATFIVLQNPLGYGPIQVRISEAITVLALFTPAAIPGLALGSVVANSFMLASFPLAWLDVVFGSAGTLLGALWTWRFRKRPAIALLGPVLSNALIVSAYLPIMLKGLGLYKIPLLGVDLEGHWLPMYLFGVVTVGIGQVIAVYGLGYPLQLALRRLGFEERLHTRS